MKRYLFCLLSLMVLMANESFAKVQDNIRKDLLSIEEQENAKHELMTTSTNDVPKHVVTIVASGNGRISPRIGNNILDYEIREETYQIEVLEGDSISIFVSADGDHRIEYVWYNDSLDIRLGNGHGMTWNGYGDMYYRNVFDAFYWEGCVTKDTKFSIQFEHMPVTHKLSMEVSDYGCVKIDNRYRTYVLTNNQEEYNIDEYGNLVVTLLPNENCHFVSLTQAESNNSDSPTDVTSQVVPTSDGTLRYVMESMSKDYVMTATFAQGAPDESVGHDGDVFTATNADGLELKYMIISESEKTCQVGSKPEVGYGSSLDPPAAVEGEIVGTVNIPEIANGYRVVKIGFQAFYNCNKITKINIPNSVTDIGDLAMAGTSITSLTIPSSVTRFSCGATTECDNLISINVESGNSIYDSRENCNAVIDTKSNTLVRGCRSSTIPVGVSEIGLHAFDLIYGDGFTISLPNTVKTIGIQAFNSCSLTAITLPESLTSVGYACFAGSQIEEIRIPANMRDISAGGFCVGTLKKVISELEMPFEVPDDAFGNYETAILYVPVGTKALYQKTKGWKNFLNIVEQEEVNPENCEPYAVYKDGVLTFYYDDKKGTREGTVYGLNKGYSDPGWYNDHRTDITKAVFDNSFAGARPTSTYYWFAVKYNETSNLTEIQGIQNLNTSNVTNMGSMFWGCSSLTILDVSHFDTSNVTYMGSMFNGCSGLTSLDVSHFDTGNVTSMGSMFWGCSSLTILDVSHFDTSNVTYMGSMFNGCSGLTSLDVSHFDTGNVTSMYFMFSNCSSLTSLDVSHFDTSNVTDMGSMFSNCSSLTSLDVSHFNTGNVTNMYSMFSNCSSLTILDVSHFDTGNVTNMSGMFYGCSSLTSLDVSHFDTGNVTNMYSMFSNCSSLTILDVSHFDTGNVTSMYSMFYGCSGLTSLDVSHFDTSNVTSMGSMFHGCSGLTSLDVNHFDTGNVTGMSSMFSGCSGLTSLDVSHFDTGNVTRMGGMFYGCSSLTSLDVSHFDTGNVTYIEMMFYGCGGLTSLDVSHFDTKNVTGMYAMFRGCSSLTSLDLSNFDTSNVTDMLSMFNGCSSLTSLNVSNFDTSNVTNMGWMFYGCSNLSNIYCNNTWTCSSSSSMFYNCKSLPGFNSANSNVDYAKPIDLGGYFTRVENNPNGIIDFADAEVKRICVENWDTNGDGELSYGEAAAVTDLNMRFYYNHEIEYFNELKYFTGLKNIRSSEFRHCVKLSHVELPNTIESIGSYAFHNAPLYEMKLPESLKTIGNWAFQSCRNLSTLYIPMNVEQIGSCITSDTPFMESVIVDEDNPKYDSRGNCNAIIETVTNTLLLACKNTVIPNTVTTIGTNAYCWCKGIQSIILPNSVTKIDNQGIYGCIDLESIKIPNSVTSIGEKAFMYCDSLKSVIVDIGVPLPIGEQTFSNRTKAFLYVPYGCKAAYEAADYWKEFKEIIEVIPDNYLHADDVTVRPGVQKTITLQLDNENTFVAGEFRLQLPAGMRMETDEDGEPVANLVSGRSNKHTLMVTDEGNGLYHFLLYSGQNRAILGNSGDFISLSVIADEGVEDGSYTAKLKNVFFSTEDEKRIDLPDIDFNINVLDYTPGDVNGDGSLNVMDVVKLVNYIMGRNPSDFVFVAADMDENGKINVMDLVNVVEVIMAAPQQAPVMGMATFGNLELDRTSKNTVSLSVPDADRHIAAQFTVTLSGNAVLKDVLSDDAHQSEVTRMPDGSYKVMVYSGRNDLFKSNSPISLQLSGNCDVKIDDVVFVDADEEAVAYEPVMTNTTGILSVGTEFSQPTDIYTVNGSLVKKNATSMRGLASGVYIVNNEKVVIK